MRKLTDKDREILARCADADYLIDGKWFFCSVADIHPATAARMAKTGLLERKVNLGGYGLYAITDAGRAILKDTPDHA